MRTFFLSLLIVFSVVFILDYALPHSCTPVAEVIYDDASQTCYVTEMCIDEDTPLVERPRADKEPDMGTEHCIRRRYCLFA